MDVSFMRLNLALHTLTVFKELAESAVIKAFQTLCSSIADEDIVSACACYAEVYYSLVEAGTADIGKYISDGVRFGGVPLAKALLQGTAEQAYRSAAKRDIGILAEVAGLPCPVIKHALLNLSDGSYNDLLNSLPEWGTSPIPSYDALEDFFRRQGSGSIAKYRAFYWDGEAMTPVALTDPVRFEQMVGYDWQRKSVLENTEALLAGSWVNNVLLYGDSGTGKSATIKSMLNIAAFQNLALIEISKKHLTGLPKLLHELSWRPQKFILFIDDLSFEGGDSGYSALKVILEGSLEQRPQNVAIYVTSNRRQLVRRAFSDRDEMNGSETVQEKTSLADRFGLRIPFFSLNQEDYLKTVEVLARQSGVNMDKEALLKAALQWEIEHGSRTPRTARQFVDEIVAKRQHPLNKDLV